MSRDVNCYTREALDRVAQAVRSLAVADTVQDAADIRKAQLVYAREHLAAAMRATTDAIGVLSE